MIDDLVTIHGVMSDSLSNGRWWPDPFAVSLAAWHENRGLLANAVSNDDWSIVAAAFHRYGVLEMARVATINTTYERDVFEQYIPRVEACIQRVQDGAAVLAYRSLNKWERIWWQDRHVLAEIKRRVVDDRGERQRQMQAGRAESKARS
ncbi:MAG TPA: hypothetical protein VGO31_10345 [Microbacteriaceae bacterium]|nr:hypothetical protein [Microbacteriaceae bacterium]